MNETEVIALMHTSKSEAEWNTNCDEVKRRCKTRDGRVGYPEFWFSVAIVSGLMTEIRTTHGW